nr:hypothetical protein [Rubellimicrobium thermophilum]
MSSESSRGGPARGAVERCSEQHPRIEPQQRQRRGQARGGQIRRLEPEIIGACGPVRFGPDGGEKAGEADLSADLPVGGRGAKGAALDHRLVQRHGRGEADAGRGAQALGGDVHGQSPDRQALLRRPDGDDLVRAVAEGEDLEEGRLPDKLSVGRGEAQIRHRGVEARGKACRVQARPVHLPALCREGIECPGGARLDLVLSDEPVSPIEGHKRGDDPEQDAHAGFSSAGLA